MRAVLPLLAALLLAGCTAAPTPPSAPAEVGRIDGAVVDGLLNPYPFQNVTLVNLNLVDQTSPLGGFTFRGIPPGTYTLITQKAGTDGDVRVVDVHAGQITRVILQMLPHHDPVPFVETHRFTNVHSDLATPGAECDTCLRSAFILEQPKEMVLQSIWDGLPAGDSTLTITLTTEAGRVLGSATGASPLELDVHSDLPAQQKVLVHVHFGPDFTPRPFQMSSLLTLYYVKDRAGQQASG